MGEEAASMTYEKGQLYTIPPAAFRFDPNQPRKYLDPQALEELTASIREHGILEPVLFRRDEEGRPILVAGERRVSAAQLAGLDSVPAVLVDGNHHEIALVENLLRQDLTAVEEAEALDRIMKEHGYKHEDLCKVICKAPSTLSEILSLNRLPQEIRDECRGNPTISRRKLVEIAKSKQQRSMRTLFKKYREKSLTRDQIKKHARRDRRTASERAVGFIGTVQMKIPTWTIDEFAAADKEAFVVALTDLKKAIEEQIDALKTVQSSRFNVQRTVQSSEFKVQS